MPGWTERLLRHFNRVWSKDPAGVLALRLRCDGSNLTWVVQDDVLTTTPVGGTAAPLAIDLGLYTITSLANYLALQPGYLVLFVDTGVIGPLSAMALYDQAGDVNTSNGDHLLAFTNPTWAILGAYARELAAAKAQIVQMLLQMAIPTAEGEWIDLQGSYYGVPRTLGETDLSYGNRIVPQVLLPKGNNVAIANIIQAVIGQPVRVVDVLEYTPSEPMFDGATPFDGSRDFNSSASPIYGLFDVQVGQDLLGAGLPLPTELLLSLVEASRDAGTQLRSLTGAPSLLADAAPLPATDAAELTVTKQTLFDGTYTFDGAADFSGAETWQETLLG